MSKKLIIAIALVLAIAVVFCACERKRYTEVDKVTGDDGKEIIIYEDEEGSKYVDNKDGDKVPVTSDVDGFYDDLNSVVENSTSKKNDKNDKDDKEEPSKDGIINIGGEDSNGGDATISWDDIAEVS